MPDSTATTVTANPAGGLITLNYRVTGIVRLDLLDVKLRRAMSPPVDMYLSTTSPVPSSGPIRISATPAHLAGGTLECLFYISAPNPPAAGVTITVEADQGGTNLGAAHDNVGSATTVVRSLRISFT
jgi:hypothetical protein